MAKVPDNVAAAVAAAVGVAKAAQAAQDAVSYAKAAQATDRAVTYAQAAQTTQKAVTTAKRAQRPRPRPKRRYTHPEAKKVARRVVERGLEKGLSRRQMVKATERITQRLGWDDPGKPSKSPGGREIQSPPGDLHRQAVRAVNRYLSAPTDEPSGPVSTERPDPRKPVRRDPSDPTDGPVNTERPSPQEGVDPRVRRIAAGVERKVEQIRSGDTPPTPAERQQVRHRLKKAVDKVGDEMPADVPAQYRSIIARASRENGVPAGLLAAVLRQESGFQAHIGSPAGAQGIAQFMPGTAAGMGVDPNDPKSAIPGAARLLKGNKDQFGSWPLALAAYNAGGGAVSQYGGIPPYAETQNYVKTIMAAWDGDKGTGGKVRPALVRKARETIGPINTKAILKDVDLSSAEKVKNPDQRRAVRSILVGKVPAGAEGLLGKAAVKALEQGGKIVKGSKRKLSATEVFYDGADSYYDNGTWTEGQFGDHGDHVHFASEDPASILLVARKAQELGMLQGGVGENPAFDTLDAHDPSSGSYHVREMDMPEGLKGLRKATGASGPVLGEALDIAGSPEQMAAMQKWIAENLGEGVATGPRIKGTDLQVIVPAEEGSAGTSSGTGISTGASTGGTSTGSTGKGKKQKARRRRRPLPSAQLDDDALGTYLAVGADTPVDPFIERLIELQQS